MAMNRNFFLFLLIQFAVVCTALGRPIDYAELFRKTAPAVVVVFGADAQNATRGTGSIIDESGLVLTNAHVVTQGDKPWPELYVYLLPSKLTGDNRKDLSRAYPARLMAVNGTWDLALLQIQDPPANLPVLALAGNHGAQVGEPVAAIGHPDEGALWSLTTGQVSALWKDYQGQSGWDLLQTQTPLNPGNSGGPLLDGDGTIVGINVMVVRENYRGEALEGINFAVDAKRARLWAEETIGKLPVTSKIPAIPASLPETQKVVQAKGRNQLDIVPKSFLFENDIFRERTAKLKIGPDKRTNYRTFITPGEVLSARKLLQAKQKIEKIQAQFDKDPFFQ